MNQDSAQATNIRSYTVFQQENAIRHQRWELASVLQTTLNVEQLMDLFSETIREMSNHCGYIYVNEKHGISLTSGNTAHHSCSYRLIVENQDLGELKLVRRRRFSNYEISRVETILCCLVYPLKNALAYREALSCAHTDPLTGINNRVAMEDCIHREWELAHRQRTSLSLMLLDLDHFKQINDTHGHACGDKVLKSVADCLRNTARASDMIYRYGGEEFVIVLSNTDRNGALLLAERIRIAIENLGIEWEGTQLSLTASSGVACVKPDCSVNNLLNDADSAMYRAKANGRNQVVAAD